MHEQDVATFKEAIPCLRRLSDRAVELLYAEFSDQEHFAGWMDTGLNSIVDEFALWVQAPGAAEVGHE